MVTLIDSQMFPFLNDSDYTIPDNAGTDIPVVPRRGGLTREQLDPIATRRWTRVLSWITFKPDQVAELVDREGQTALHHACLFRAPLEILEAMVCASHDLASVRNDAGELALHWAVRLALSMETLKTLVEAYPSGAFLADNSNHSPLSLLWDRHDHSLMQIYRTMGQEGVLNSTQWKRIMLFVKGNSDQKRDLHAIASTHCPSSFLRFATLIFKGDISVKDRKGRTPLALCASSTRMDEDIDWTYLTILLHTFPAAAGIPDACGRLPLHLALESNRTWEGGIKALLKAEPRSLTMRDPISRLYPFMFAASTNSEIDTIYNLLLKDPEYVRPMI